MSIEQIDLYIKSECIDPHTQRDDYAGYVQDALCFTNSEARELVGHLIDADLTTELNPISKLLFFGKVAGLIKAKLLVEYRDQAATYAREQEEITHRGVLREIQENIGDVA